jgi:hypothetical protein
MVYRFGKGASQPVTPRPEPSPVITVELEWPHESLSPNARTHWTVKAQWTKYARDLAFVKFTEAVDSKPRWVKARYSVVGVLAKGRRVPDDDNFLASLKAFRDGMQDAGIVSNDRRLHLEGDVTFTRDKSLSESKVILTVWRDDD